MYYCHVRWGFDCCCHFLLAKPLATHLSKERDVPRHDANAWQYLKGLGLVTGGKQLMQFIGHVNSWDSYQLYELAHMFLSLSLSIKNIDIYIYTCFVQSY